ncbi:hypothetical protein SBRCBS47491_006593 [Sporothrix bragantina]|uniref:Uncharacterized protein n=1 Tax=Sporothrix bragantina TaxID=671064 RepID=A0ABP0C6R2_9PEZI
MSLEEMDVVFGGANHIVKGADLLHDETAGNTVEITEKPGKHIGVAEHGTAESKVATLV